MKDGNIAEAIESSFFWIPELPGRLEHLSIPGTRGWMSSSAHAKANYAGLKNQHSASYEDVIDQIYKLFTASQKEFTWVVGPTGQSNGLAEKLLAKGLNKSDDMMGMVLHPIDPPSPDEENIRIDEALGDDRQQIPQIIAASFDVPVQVAQLYHDAYMQHPEHHRSRAYVAYIDKSSNPVAFAYLSYLPQYSSVLLRAAGTLPQYRGQGIYTQLVKRRLVVAKKEGIDRAMVQAARNTSAALLTRLGFEEICTLKTYEWKQSKLGSDEKKSS